MMLAREASDSMSLVCGFAWQEHLFVVSQLACSGYKRTWYHHSYQVVVSLISYSRVRVHLTNRVVSNEPPKRWKVNLCHGADITAIEGGTWWPVDAVNHWGTCSFSFPAHYTCRSNLKVQRNSSHQGNVPLSKCRRLSPTPRWPNVVGGYPHRDLHHTECCRLLPKHLGCTPRSIHTALYSTFFHIFAPCMFGLFLFREAWGNSVFAIFLILLLRIFGLQYKAELSLRCLLPFSRWRNWDMWKTWILLVFIIWQSWTPNFHRKISATRIVREAPKS